MGVPEETPDRPRPTLRQAFAIAVITIAELLVLLTALIPVMGATAPLGSGKPAHLSYLWWSGLVTKPVVLIIASKATVDTTASGTGTKDTGDTGTSADPAGVAKPPEAS